MNKNKGAGAPGAGEEEQGRRRGGNERYDPADFIVPGSDHNGHHERGYFNMPPPMDRAADEILRSKKFPFRTKGDIWRWAGLRGIQVLQKLEPVHSFVGQALLVIELCRADEYRQTYMAMFEHLQRSVAANLANKMPGEARRLVAMARAEVDKIEEDEWRRRCKEELKERFGHLLVGGARSQGEGGEAGSRNGKGLSVQLVGGDRGEEGE